MEQIRLIKQEDYQRMAWKNGLGVTNQIDIQPPGSPFPGDTFSWRLSSATVSGTSAFSLFPACDRILVVLKGNGLILNDTITLKPYDPYSFSGEEPINCKVINDDTVIDFGIIFRRDHYASLNIISFGSSKDNNDISPMNSLNLLKGTHYITCIEGSFTVGDTVVNLGDTLMIVEKGVSDSVVIVSKGYIKFCHVHVSNKLD